MTSRLKLVTKLGIDYPIFLSPMAGVSTIDMAIAVTNNGGLGSIPLSSIDFRKFDSIEKLDNLINQYKQKLVNHRNNRDDDNLVVNLNFFCHEIENEPTQSQINNWKQLYKQTIFNSNNNSNDEDNDNDEDSNDNYNGKLLDEIQFINGNISFKEIENNENYKHQYNQLIKYLQQLKPKIISFHFGIPNEKTIEKLQSHGIMIFITSTSLEETIYLTDNNINIDGIILQGYEAGGHRGNFLIKNNQFDEKLSTYSLFIQLKQYLDRNIISNNQPRQQRPYLIPTGGIMDTKTINYYLSLGADSIQMGTIFLATPESINHKFFNQNIMKNFHYRKPTIMIDSVSGKFARAIKTDFINNLINNSNNYSSEELPSYGYAYYGYKSLKSKIKKDNIGFYLAGQNYYQIEQKNKLTQEIMKMLIKGLEIISR